MHVASPITVDKSGDVLINKLTGYFTTGKFFRMMGSSSPPFCLIKQGHWSMQPARRDMCCSQSRTSPGCGVQHTTVQYKDVRNGTTLKEGVPPLFDVSREARYLVLFPW